MRCGMCGAVASIGATCPECGVFVSTPIPEPSSLDKATREAGRWVRAALLLLLVLGILVAIFIVLVPILGDPYDFF